MTTVPVGAATPLRTSTPFSTPAWQRSPFYSIVNVYANPNGSVTVAARRMTAFRDMRIETTEHMLPVPVQPTKKRKTTTPKTKASKHADDTAANTRAPQSTDAIPSLGGPREYFDLFSPDIEIVRSMQGPFFRLWLEFAPIPAATASASTPDWQPRRAICGIRQAIGFLDGGGTPGFRMPTMRQFERMMVEWRRATNRPESYVYAQTECFYSDVDRSAPIAMDVLFGRTRLFPEEKDHVTPRAIVEIPLRLDHAERRHHHQ